MRGGRNFSLEAERHWKSKVRKRRVEKGRSRSSEEKEQGSGLITETDGDRRDKMWAGNYTDFCT